MDKVKLGSNYPEITGNAVFFNHECFGRFDIEIEHINPPQQGMTLNEALISGAVDFTHLLSHPLLAAVQGHPVKYVAAYQEHGFEVIARPEIKSLAGLNGKKVAFATPMMNKNFFYAFMRDGGDLSSLTLAGYGGSIHQEVMGIAMADLDYLRDGRIDAMALLPPMSSAAMGEGMRSLFRHGDPFPTPVFGLMARDEMIQGNRDLLERMVSALKESIDEYLSDRQFGIELVRRVGTDEAFVESAYDMSRYQMHPLSSLPEYIQREWIENEKQLEQINAAVPLAQVFDFSIVREME